MLLCAKTSEINTAKNRNTYAQKKKFGSGGAKAILEKTGGKCWYCGVVLTDNSRINDPKLSVKHKATMFTIDHYVPMATGGSRTKSTNLLPCCNQCNNFKGRGSQEWLRTKLLFIKNSWPKFTHHQYEFLVNHGIHLEAFGKYTFFFEEYKLLKNETDSTDTK